MFDRTPSAVDVTIGGETRIYRSIRDDGAGDAGQTVNGHAGGIELRESRPSCCGARSRSTPRSAEGPHGSC